MYKKEYTIRFSEIDANLHLTSSAYVKLITDTRMSYFEENNFGLAEMRKYRIGPVVINEKCYYFREIHPGTKITVSLEMAAHTDDKSIAVLEQRIFGPNGKNMFAAQTTVTFIDLNKRKTAEFPEELIALFEKLPKSKRFRIMDRSEARDPEIFPEHLE